MTAAPVSPHRRGGLIGLPAAAILVGFALFAASRVASADPQFDIAFCENPATTCMVGGSVVDWTGMFTLGSETSMDSGIFDVPTFSATIGPSSECIGPGACDYDSPDSLFFGLPSGQFLSGLVSSTTGSLTFAANLWFTDNVAGDEAETRAGVYAVQSNSPPAPPTAPEPATVMLLGLGLVGLGFARRRLR